MSTILRPANLFLLLTYLILSAVPFFPMFLGRPVAWGQVLIIEVLVWAAIWAACKRPAWFHLLLLPAFLVLPVEVYLQLAFGQTLSVNHLGIIFESSPRESLEFLGSKIWLLLFVALLVLAWFGYSWRLALRTPDLQMGERWRLGLIFMSLALVCLWNFGDMQKWGRAYADSASSTASSPNTTQAPGETATFADTWPFGLASRGMAFMSERYYLTMLEQQNRNFKFGARASSQYQGPQLVVMVIGESSRADRWSLNGYTRDTNPLLKQESNLVVLPDFISGVTSTRLSVPVMLTRKSITSSTRDDTPEKSFITAYKEAGFKTYWISNQILFGQLDNPISVLAKESDVMQFLNLGGLGDAPSFDQTLLEPMQKAMADKSEKKLIVLHTLGNHWNYSRRHPKEFDRWQPSLMGIDKAEHTDASLKLQMNNSYDNSVLYADWFLAQVIARLRSSGQVASMLFVADHGQALHDGACSYSLHAHNTEVEFHVPAMVWYSDPYQHTFPDKVQQLKRNQRSRLSTENVFHTMLDFADIQYPEARHPWSLLHPQFTEHKRLVSSYGWADYDNSIRWGACAELVDKDSRLAKAIATRQAGKAAP